MSDAGIMTVGDASGFAALILIGLTAVLMLVRSKLLRITKNLQLIRGVHLASSALAGLFLILHIAYLFMPPLSTGVDIGYASLGISVAVWISGTAFLERLRDSLFFHATLASMLLGLSLVHAATTSPNLPFVWSQMMLAGTAVIMLVNASFHLMRAFAHPKVDRQ